MRKQQSWPIGRLHLCPVALLTASIAIAAPNGSPALTPPLGWNSWDAYGTTVRETEVKANADYMASKLKSHGWEYIVVDIQWSDPAPKSHGYRKDAELVMDGNGRLLPAPTRFPSAADGSGFTSLASYIHRQGLKFGIHMMRGIPRRAVDRGLAILGTHVTAADVADRNSVCRWNGDMYGVDMQKPGAQAYYDSIVKMYASWGVDYIKADDMAIPFHGPEIGALHRAIEHGGRPMVLSLSPGPADLTKAAFYAQNANLWRISDDFWDRWDSLKKNFTLLAQWAPHTGPGAWPDADMLPLGRIGLRAERGEDRRTHFTPDEQRTMMTLWCIARSPLMFGGDLPSNDDATLALIDNDEVLAVNQQGRESSPARSAVAGQVVWISGAPDKNSKYVAAFNIGDSTVETIHLTWKDLGLGHRVRIRDLWERQDLGAYVEGYDVPIRPHASALYRLQSSQLSSDVR